MWHTGIVAYGREYFFTDRGLVSVMPVRSKTDKRKECPEINPFNSVDSVIFTRMSPPP